MERKQSKTLTHLSLFRQHYSGRYTVAEFLDVLRDSPTLEELNLVNAGPFKMIVILAHNVPFRSTHSADWRLENSSLHLHPASFLLALKNAYGIIIAPGTCMSFYPPSSPEGHDNGTGFRPSRN